MKNKFFLIGLGVVLVIIFGVIVVKNYKSKTSFKYDKSSVQDVKSHAQDPVNKHVNNSVNKPIEIDEKILNISKSELFLGSEDAPVVIVEYASLSCPHCASFYSSAFDKIKEEYIDTKKVKFVYRDFPLNQPALAGAVVAVCRAQMEQENPTQAYYNFIKALFKTQDTWAFEQDFIDKLQSIALLDGMSQEQFKACIDDQKLQEKMLKARMIAAKSLNLKSTPSFFINGELFEGFVDYKSLKKAIDKKL